MVSWVRSQGASWAALSSGAWIRKNPLSNSSRIHFLVWDGASSRLLAGGCPPHPLLPEAACISLLQDPLQGLVTSWLLGCLSQKESLTPVSSGVLREVTRSWVWHGITFAVFCWLEAIHRFWLQLSTQRSWTLGHGNSWRLPYSMFTTLPMGWSPCNASILLHYCTLHCILSLSFFSPPLNIYFNYNFFFLFWLAYLFLPVLWRYNWHEAPYEFKV